MRIDRISYQKRVSDQAPDGSWRTFEVGAEASVADGEDPSGAHAALRQFVDLEVLAAMAPVFPKAREQLQAMEEAQADERAKRAAQVLADAPPDECFYCHRAPEARCPECHEWACADHLVRVPNGTGSRRLCQDCAQALSWSLEDVKEQSF